MTPVYHVEITPKTFESPHRRVEHETDLSLEELERRFITPYGRAETIVVRGRLVSVEDLHRIRIYRTDHGLGILPELPKDEMLDVTNEFIVGPPGLALEKQSHKGEPTSSADPRVVFVVHGRNHVARDAFFDFLKAIDLHPLEWSEAVRATASASPYIGEILDAAFSRAQAVVVLLTPDDEARLRRPLWESGESPQETVVAGQARPNVLFEAGMAMARDPRRTVLVELGTLRPFSDIAGRHTVRLDNTSERRQDLALRLRQAGCSVNLDGTDWHSAGDFQAALDFLHQASSKAAGVGKIPTYGGVVAISGDAANLLIEAMDSNLRVIQRLRSPNGTVIKANGKSFGGLEDLRSGTSWERALSELVDSGLVVEDDSSDGEIFGVTDAGFDLVDSFEASQYVVQEEIKRKSQEPKVQIE